MNAYLGKRTPAGGHINTDEDLALYLLKTANVVTIPGSKFYRPGHLCFAYAVNFQTIETGIACLAEALDRL